MAFHRPQAALPAARLREPRRFLQVVAGPRQVGKTTLVQGVVEAAVHPVRFAGADEPTLRSANWIGQQWEAARPMAADTGKSGAVQVLDESQKIPGWSFAEMRAAFGWSLDKYLFYGGSPGAAPLVRDAARWARYVKDALIESSVARDVLLLSRVDKPALLRRLFELACRYSGQVMSSTKMLGQLQDAGSVTTLAHYLDLLAGAGLVAGLQKYAGDVARQRGSSPKLQVMNTALLTAQSGLTLAEARADREFRGRLVESAVGAHRLNAAASGECYVYCWRERNHEVDFVVRAGRRLTAIEVESGHAPAAPNGMSAFTAQFKPQRTLLVGGDDIALEEFLARPVAHWIAS